MKKTLSKISLVGVSMFFCVAGFASDQVSDAPVVELPDDAVVAERGGATLTVGAMRAKLRAALPPEAREGFFADGARVATLIDGLLGTRQIAEEARRNGLDQNPEIRTEIEEYVNDLLARRQIAQHLESLDEPDFSLLARERYLANKSEYIQPETRDARHILILTEGRTEAEAKEIAEKVHQLLVQGEDFIEVLQEYSEDPAASHAGRVPGVRVGGNFDPAFTEAVFALEKVEDISGPVLTGFGYHVIRLDRIIEARHRSFDEVEEELVSKIRYEHRMAARQHYIDTFTSQPLNLKEETMTKLPFAEP